jgi:hypothetical protein
VLVPEPLCAKPFGTPAGHSSVNAFGVVVTFSLKVMTMADVTAMFVAPAAGVVPFTVGARSPIGVPVTLMSSMPIHSSLLAASVVMILTCTTGWLPAAAGSVTLTGVTSVARLGPEEASATKPAGRLV